MCRKLVLAATVLSLIAAPAWAAERKAKSKSDAAATTAAPGKAGAEQRAAADRLDPLARATFWAGELQIDPADETAGLKLAQALRQLGQHQKAIETAERVTITNPNSAEAWLEVARGHIGQGQGFFAIDPARRAQALRPKDWRAASLLGVALEQTGRYPEAEAAYAQALQLSPNNPSVLSNLAMFRAGQGKGDEAESLLRRAVAQPGATIEVRQNLSLVLGLRGKLAEAEALMRQDLPPEVANNNLAYLRAVAAGEKPADRSWKTLQQSQDGG